MHQASSSAHPAPATRAAASRTPRLAARGLLGGACLSLLLAGCNNTSSPSGGTLVPGTYQTNATTGLGFIVDPSNGGLGNTLGVTQTYFGRLVTVVGFEGSPLGTLRRTMHRDLVMNPTDLGNGVDYEVQTDRITGSQTLVIFRDVTDPAGLVSFQQIVTAVSNNLRVITDSGFVGAGAYTMVPRNAAVVVQFNDLIDPETINSQAINVVAGVPAVVPFESRIIPDANHGDLADRDNNGTPEFYTTRIIVDATVSEVESFETIPPRPVNTTGFPASVNQLLSNAQVRLPTRVSGLSTSRLVRNLSGHTLAPTGNGSVDFGDLERPLVRAFRAGGNQAVTGDPYNGYLRDETPPRIVGSLDLAIEIAPTQSFVDPLEFTLPQIRFGSAFCAQSPSPGDLITQPGVFARVLNSAGVDTSGVARDVRVRLVIFPPNWTGPEQFIESGVAPAQYLAEFDPIGDAATAVCFFEISPPPTGYPGDPATGLLPNTQFTVRFNEPIAASSLSVYDTFGVTRLESPIEPIDYVPGTLQRSVDLQEYTFSPDLPLAHVQGTAERYFVGVSTVPIVPTDLAGNGLVAAVPPTEVTLEASIASQQTGGRVIRFTGPDEEAPRDSDPLPDPNDPTIPVPGDPTPGLSELIPEWNGQHVYDIARQLIRPRPVTRTQLIADRNTGASAAGANLVGNMAQPLTGQSVPLSSFGAKTQILYRWFDFDLPFKTDDRIDERLDREFLNVDVEGMALSPLGSGIVFESYPRFRMTMGHGQFLPDEVVDAFGNIAIPGSGITTVFENNFLNIVEDVPRVVHADFRGYLLNPGDVFQASSGTNFLPMPMNRGVSASQKRYYTWRDTFLRTRGGANGVGVYPQRWYQLSGRPLPIFPGPDMMGNLTDCNLPPAGTACVNLFYSGGNVRTAGLPLMVEFDCFATAGAQTLNVFDVNTAHPTQTTPFFRAFSVGGFDPTGAQVTVDPDLEIIANGGFDPMGMPPGTGTPGTDNTFYLGALDLVVRISRSTSIFYPAVDPLLSDNNEFTYDDPRFPNPVFFPALLDPRQEDQPAGTSIQVNYRGASVVPNLDRARIDATQMDPYGDFYPDREIALTNICDLPGPPPMPGSVSHDPILCDGTTILENPGIAFLNGVGDSWVSDITRLNGSQFIQVHLTFISNVETGLSPTLSSLALSWAQ